MYANNEEVKLYSSQFKSMISRVSRMLGHLVDDEERKTTDLPACLGEPQNDPQNLKKAIVLGQITQGKGKEKILTDSTNKRISDIQSDISKQLHQFKQEIQADLEIRINDVVKQDELNQKLLTVDQKYNKLAEQMEEIKGNFQIELQHLNDQITEISAKTDSIKHQTQDQISNQTNQLLEFQQLLKSKDDNINIAVDNQQIQNQIQDQEAAIALLQLQVIRLNVIPDGDPYQNFEKLFTQTHAHQRWY
eukprot:403352597